MNLFKRYAVAVVLLWTLGAGLYMAWNDSMTTDEGIHVASAYLAIKRQDFRFDPEHPYLFKALTALPVMLLHPNLPSEDAQLWAMGYPTTFDSWVQSRSWAEHWFYTSGNNARLMIFLARIPGVLCMVSLCWLVYYLGALWWSKRVGFFALLFTAFNPNILAHGHLTNTDGPVALAFLGVTWALWRYYQTPTLKWAAWLGLILGLAQITKFSALTLVPSVVIWMYYCWRHKGEARKAWGHLLLAFFICLAVIWIAYLMPLHIIQGTAFQIRGDANLPATIQKAAPIANGLFKKILFIRFLLPIDYVKGILLVGGGSVLGRSAYLLGVSHPSGFWYYFPTLYLLKTQLTGLLLLALAAALLATQAARRRLKVTPVGALVLAVAGVFAFISVVNKLNIGIRHILPLMPFASFAMALATEWLFKRSKVSWMAPTALAAYCLAPFAQFPHYIGYSNVFVSPPSSAYKDFNDSNLDWGQQARMIADLTRDKYGNQAIFINFQWSPYAMQYYGAITKAFTPQNKLQPGLYVVQAGQLSAKKYVQFTKMTPIDSIGDDTFFYRVK